MKRKLFYLLERLQIKRSERIAISFLMIVTVITTLLYSSADLIFPKPEFDYSVSDSIFAARSAQFTAERERILERYSPEIDVHFENIPQIEAVLDTVPPDTANNNTKVDAGSLININKASAEKLQELPGIGPAYASRIVEWRNTNGPFVSKDQLIEIRGIGEKRLETIRPLITL